MRVKFSTLTHAGSGPHPVSYALGNGSFSGVKRLGCDVNQPPPSIAEITEKVELYFHFPSVSPWQVVGFNSLSFLLSSAMMISYEYTNLAKECLSTY